MSVSIADLTARLKRANAHLHDTGSLKHLPIRSCIDIVVKLGSTKDNLLFNPFVFSNDGKHVIPLHVLDREIRDILDSDDEEVKHSRARISDVARNLNVSDELIRARCAGNVQGVEVILNDVVLTDKYFSCMRVLAETEVARMSRLSVQELAAELDLPVPVLHERVVHDFAFDSTGSFLVHPRYFQILEARLRGVLRGIETPHTMIDIAMLTETDVHTVQSLIPQAISWIPEIILNHAGLVIPRAYTQEQARLARVSIERNGWCSITGFKAMADGSDIDDVIGGMGYVRGLDCVVGSEYFVTVSGRVRATIMEMISGATDGVSFVDVKTSLRGVLPSLGDHEWMHVSRILEKDLPSGWLRCECVFHDISLPSRIVDSMGDSINRVCKDVSESTDVKRIKESLIRKSQSVMEKRFGITREIPNFEFHSLIESEVEHLISEKIEGISSKANIERGNRVITKHLESLQDVETQICEEFVRIYLLCTHVPTGPILHHFISRKLPVLVNRVAWLCAIKICHIGDTPIESSSDRQRIVKALPESLKNSLQTVYAMLEHVDTPGITDSVSGARSALRDLGIVVTDKLIKTIKTKDKTRIRQELLTALQTSDKADPPLRSAFGLWIIDSFSVAVDILDESPSTITELLASSPSTDSKSSLVAGLAAAICRDDAESVLVVSCEVRERYRSQE